MYYMVKFLFHLLFSRNPQCPFVPDFMVFAVKEQIEGDEKINSVVKKISI